MSNKKEYIAYRGTEFTVEWYFNKKVKIIVTNAFHKKTNKLPKGEKGKALKFKNEYDDRVQRGEYYD